MLRMVDPYGDTYFNRGQVEEQVLPELRRLRGESPTDKDGRTLDGVIELAEAVAAGTHLYLRFVGD